MEGLRRLEEIEKHNEGIADECTVTVSLHEIRCWMDTARKAREALNWALNAGNLRYYHRTKHNAEYCDGVDAAHEALKLSTGDKE